MTRPYAAFYAKFHPNDEAHRNGLRRLHHRILSPHLPAGRDEPILDVGCGRGYAMEDVRALGYTSVQGIDIDPGQSDFAHQRGLQVEHVASTEEYLRARPGKFAALLLMDVLEHVPRPQQPGFVDAVAQALRPGGNLICTVPNAASGIAAYWFYNDYTHHHSFTSDSLSSLLEGAGFAPVLLAGVELAERPRFLFWLPTKRTLRWLFVRLARLRRRAEFIGELGWDRGCTVVLTPNLLAIATRSGA